MWQNNIGYWIVRCYMKYRFSERILLYVFWELEKLSVLAFIGFPSFDCNFTHCSHVNASTPNFGSFFDTSAAKVTFSTIPRKFPVMWITQLLANNANRPCLLSLLFIHAKGCCCIRAVLSHLVYCCLSLSIIM